MTVIKIHQGGRESISDVNNSPSFIPPVAALYGLHIISNNLFP